MNKVKIGIDFDDTAAPFNSIAVKLANDKYKISPPLKLNDVTSWENTGRASVIKEFYKDNELYRIQSLSISDETKEIVSKLEEIAEVYFITAVAPEFMGVRALQIKEAFPNLPDSRIILGAAKHLVHFDFILDDNICNVLESPAKFPVLMRKPWNSNMTGLLSVNSLSEFLCLVEHIIYGRDKTTDMPRVIALVGPSGSGKNDIASAYISAHPTSAVRVPSYCTNANANGKVYVNSDAFNENDYIEITRYAGNMYGTKKGDIENALSSGKNVIIPLDMCGAIGMKKQFPTTIIYVDCKKDAIIRNLLKKDIDDEEKVLRILSIQAEKKNKEIADICITYNGDANETAKQIIF